MSYSVAVASDISGNIISSIRCDPISLHATHRENLRYRLTNLVHGVASRAGFKLDQLKGSSVCVGLTGVTFPYDAEVDLPYEFKRTGVSVGLLTCTGDAEVVFTSHTSADSGSAIICHSGSTAYFVSGEKKIRYGGWGPVYGDAGSGFRMGIAALRAVSEEHDSKRPPSRLWESIHNWLINPMFTTNELKECALIWKERITEYSRGNYDLRTALFKFVHELVPSGHWRSLVSSLAKPVIEAWLSGDDTATNIVNRAIDNLVGQYAFGQATLDSSERTGPLVLYGGVIKHNNSFREELVTRLQSRLNKRFEIINSGDKHTMRPVCGALLNAIQNVVKGKKSIMKIRERLLQQTSNLARMDPLHHE